MAQGINDADVARVMALSAKQLWKLIMLVEQPNAASLPSSQAPPEPPPGEPDQSH